MKLIKINPIKINRFYLTLVSAVFLLFFSNFFLSCTGINYEKKIPGWYTCSTKINKTFINADVTYYKNGDLKFDATVSEDVIENLSMKIKIKMIGSWTYSDGKIFEKLNSIEVSPKIVEDVIKESFYKEYEKDKDKGNTVKEINDYSMVLINDKGEETIYTRVKK